VSLSESGLQIMSLPRCCVDSSAFGAASYPALGANTEILTEDVSVYTEERSALVTCKWFSRGKGQHASFSLFGFSNYKSTLIHMNSPSPYEFFTLVQLLHQRSQCPSLASEQGNTPLNLTGTPVKSPTLEGPKVCLPPSFSAIVELTFPPLQPLAREIKKL